MHGPHGAVGVGAGDDDGELDLAGGDHADVDPLRGEGPEHPHGHAGGVHESGADDADLRKAAVHGDGAAADGGGVSGQRLLRGNDSYVAMCHRCWRKKIAAQGE